MGLAMVLLAMLGIILVVFGICIFASVIFFIVAIVRYKKGKSYNGFLIAGVVCVLPIVLMIIYGTVINFTDAVKTDKLLAYQLFHENYSKAEEMIEKGVSPDSTLKKNEEAKNGEQEVTFAGIHR